MVVLSFIRKILPIYYSKECVKLFLLIADVLLAYISFVLPL